MGSLKTIDLDDVGPLQEKNISELGHPLVQLECTQYDARHCRCPFAVFYTNGCKCIFAQTAYSSWTVSYCMCAAAVKAVLKKLLGIA